MPIKKDGRFKAFITSAQQTVAVLDPDVSCNQKKQFESGHKDWINDQNMQFEHQGLWCDDLRSW
jgi:hypothetical protein